MPQSDSGQIESLDEELVAYLDGQLDPESARQIEQRLASEEPVRRRLQQLAQSWDMLDQLPHAMADDTFTRSTVQMVAIAAEQELTQQQAHEPRRRRRRWLLGAALAVLAGSGGFLAAAMLWKDPNERLLRDLSTIENVEAYRQVGDIDFLHRLSDEGLFSEDAPDPAGAKTAPGAAESDDSRAGKEPPPSGSLDTLEQRREYLAKMPPKEMEDLRAKFEMFEALSPEEQDKLRLFDFLLNKDPQEDRLRRVMARFSDWLKTLLTTERAELLDKTSADRVQRIRSIRHGQEARLARMTPESSFSKPDVDAVHAWMTTFAKNHEEELLKDPRKRMQKDLNGVTGPRRTQLLTIMALQHWRAGEVGKLGEVGKPISVTDKELEDLKVKLSKGALKDLPTEPGEQLEAIKKWVGTVAQANWFNRRAGARSNVTAEDLRKTFEELPIEQRDRLLGLSREEIDRELRIMYFQHKYGRGTGQRDGPPPDDNPGSRDSRGSRERDRRGPRPETMPNKANSPATKGTESPPEKSDNPIPPSTKPDGGPSI
jgi:hypothetical protein